MKKKILITVATSCVALLFILNFNRWYWWQWNKMIEWGTIYEQGNNRTDND